MRQKLVSEKTFCYCSRYVHKKKTPIENIFEFNYIDKNKDSYISYDGRWSYKQSMLLDILSDLIYLNTYESTFEKYPKNSTDERVIENCKQLNDNVLNNVINNNLPYVYTLKINRLKLVELYPYIFDGFTNKDVVDFFKSGLIKMKLNYRVKLSYSWFTYEMNNFENLFEIKEIPIKVKSDGKIWESELEILFNTPLGFFFQHNIKSLNYHIIDPAIYNCKNPASIFVYKRFILCKNKRERSLNKTEIPFNTLSEFLSYETSNERLKRKYFISILKDLEQFITWKNHRMLKNSINTIVYSVFFV